MENNNGGVFGGCAIQILGAVIFIALMASNAVLALFLGIALVIVGGLVIVNVQNKVAEESRQRELQIQIMQSTNVKILSDHFKPEYDALCLKTQMPSNCPKVSLLGKEDVNCWVANGTFYLLGTLEQVINKLSSKHFTENSISNLKLNTFCFFRCIPVDNILHFQKDGDIYTETKIIGGSGGGSSIGGLLLAV